MIVGTVSDSMWTASIHNAQLRRDRHHAPIDDFIAATAENHDLTPFYPVAIEACLRG